ncbi:hypothetical protein ISCGN_033165 [Ixodes scapularis]
MVFSLKESQFSEERIDTPDKRIRIFVCSVLDFNGLCAGEMDIVWDRGGLSSIEESLRESDAEWKSPVDLPERKTLQPFPSDVISFPLDSPWIGPVLFAVKRKSAPTRIVGALNSANVCESVEKPNAQRPDLVRPMV